MSRRIALVLDLWHNGHSLGQLTGMIRSESSSLTCPQVPRSVNMRVKMKVQGRGCGGRHEGSSEGIEENGSDRPF